MKNIALLCLLLFPILLPAQDRVVVEERRYLTYGDAIYPYSFMGLRMLLLDIEETDPGLHAEMQPAFAALQRQRTSARTIAIAGGTLGAGLVLATIPWAASDPDAALGRTIGGLLAGTIVGSGSLLIARGIYRGDRDFIGFINDFNKKSEGPKLRLSGMFFTPAGGWSAGLGLRWRF